MPDGEDEGFCDRALHLEVMGNLLPLLEQARTRRMRE